MAYLYMRQIASNHFNIRFSDVVESNNIAYILPSRKYSTDNNKKILEKLDPHCSYIYDKNSRSYTIRFVRDISGDAILNAFMNPADDEGNNRMKMGAIFAMAILVLSIFIRRFYRI